MIHQVQRLVKSRYGLSGQLTALAGYEDQNFLLTADARKYVVKISVNPNDRAFIHEQNQVLLHLNSPLFPLPLKNDQGYHITDIRIGNQQLPLRVFPFIEGRFLGEANPAPEFYLQYGIFLASLDQQLMPHNHPVFIARSHEWHPSRFLEFVHEANLITDPEVRRLVRFFFMKYTQEVGPIYHLLPKSLIHGDANDWNVLIDTDPNNSEIKNQPVVRGIIDFGDMVVAPRVHELAIALAYALMGKTDLVKISQEMTRGYHTILPLTTHEIRSLYYLVAARLCTTIGHAARQELDNQGNNYHQISTEEAQKLLKKWILINPLLIQNLLEDKEWNHPNTIWEKETEIKIKIDRRNELLSRSLSLSYQQPIEMVGAAFQYMYAADGKTYLDCVNNIPHVGHCHPVVVEAGQKQMSRLNTNTRYLYDSLTAYAEKLLATFPPKLSKVFFVNSGSAATDLAVRLAKTYTGTAHFVVLDHAYHGNTQSAIALSPYKFNRKGGSGKPNTTVIIDRQVYGSKSRTRETGVRDSQRMNEPAQSRTWYSQSPIFIAESIPGCAGQVMLDKDFMQEQVREIREAGGLYIADEVQTGFGRVGKHFWGFELYEVVPDIVILGKPIANGHPMGAVVCSDAVAASFETGMEFFSSFGGNPVSCEIAHSVLQVIEEEGLQQQAKLVGEFLLHELKALQKKYQTAGFRFQNMTTFIADVRGTGLFLGIEWVKDLNSLQPDAEAASAIVNALKDEGFLLSTDGPDENVIKFKPPMCFSMQNARELLEGVYRLTV